ncbi:MAG: phosphomannomutase/phosphoglucomutase [bacterium]
MKINPFIFRNYDIRGIVPQDLDAEKVEAIGKAYGTFLRRRKIRQAVVGRDCRLSGEEFQKAFIGGLTSMGVDVINIGMVMTQMVYFAQYRFQVNGSAMITASHNPANFNGFKLGVGYSKTTLENDVLEIKNYVDNDNYFKSDRTGTVEKKEITEDYYHDVLKRINLKKKFRVVIDSRHGTTGMYIPEIFRRAGCEVIGKHLEVDGNFPVGTPDPTDEHFMNSLGEVVREEKADLGFCFDGDGDRMGLVDGEGRLLWNDVMVAIFAQEILERFKGSKIVYNTLCSQIVRETVKKNGGTPVIERTGHSFIKDKIAKVGAAFGGELSGHFFFADNAYGHDDGSYAALRILEYLSDKNMPLAELYETLPQFISSPEIKIGCPDDKKQAVIKELSKKFKSDFSNAEINDANTIPGDDGVRADFNDGMMVFRYSQNGPYITIKFEAKDQETYEARRKYVRDILKMYPDMIWEDQLCVNLEHLNQSMSF